jgi:ADP-ribose pyrophosphatase
MCAIERHDCGEWALPGGMVDPGENVSVTLRREFMEEALNTNVSSTLITNFFAEGKEIYKGYVDDPRNTDNAWMETVAVNFHDQTGEYVGGFQLTAGDDAAKVKWMDINKSIKLYASHSLIVEKVVKTLKAHW